MKSALSARTKLLSLLILATACAKDSPLAPGTHLTFGDWGGDKAEVTASATVTHVTLNCSFGDFAANPTVDSDGRFSISGSWNRSVGPIQINGNMPAQLSGQILGNTLTFAIAVNDTTAKQVTSLGPATVVFGKKATIVVCPV